MAETAKALVIGIHHGGDGRKRAEIQIRIDGQLDRPVLTIPVERVELGDAWTLTITRPEQEEQGP